MDVQVTRQPTIAHMGTQRKLTLADYTSCLDAYAKKTRKGKHPGADAIGIRNALLSLFTAAAPTKVAVGAVAGSNVNDRLTGRPNIVVTTSSNNACEISDEHMGTRGALTTAIQRCGSTLWNSRQARFKHLLQGIFHAT